MVCAEGRGNTERFAAPITAGATTAAALLKVVPFEQDMKRNIQGLKAVPRVSVYRGFIFASLAASVPNLE